MPFASYSAGDLTAIRAGTSHLFYTVDCNLGVLYTGTPASNASGYENSSITMTTTVTSALVNATVIVTKNGESLANAKNLPTDEVLVTYVRKAASGTTLYIGRTAFQWTTSSRVYVLGEFRPQQMPSNVSGTTVYKNAEITFRPPLPRIYGVYPHVVTTTSTTANYQPSPSAEAMASGASISSWSWNKIAPSGTVSTAISASQSPSLTLDVGVNWLQVVVTDNGGRTNNLAFPVVVVNTDYDGTTVRLSDTGISISRDADSGNSGIFTALADLSDLLLGSPFLVFSQNIYASGASDDVSVLHFGYVNQVSDLRQTDTATGYQLSTDIELQGIAGMMALLSVPAFQVEEVASPATWSTRVELALLTPKHAAWFMLSEHTTVANVASINFDSTANDYRFGVIQTPSGNLWDAMNTLMFRMTARADVTPNGELYYVKDGSYLLSVSDRNALSTILTIATTDCLDNLAPRLSYTPAIRQVYSGAASYSTTTKSVIVFEAHAPAGYYADVFHLNFNGNILEDNLSEADARINSGLLANNYSEYSADVDTIQLALLGGFLDLSARVGAWVKISVASTDFVTGVVWEASTRWQITRVDFAHDDAFGQIVTGVTLRKETGGNANYAIYSALLDLNISPVQLFLPPGTGAFEDLSDYISNYDDGSPVYYEDVSQPEEIRPATQNPREGETVVNVPMAASTVINTGITMVNGTTYRLDISPTFGTIQKASGNVYDYTIDEQTWASNGPNTVDGWGATYSAGVGWLADDGRASNAMSNDYRRSAMIVKSLLLSTLTGISVTYSSTGGNANRIRVGYFTAPTVFYGILDHTQSGTDITTTWTGSENIGSLPLLVFLEVDKRTTAGALTGSGKITSLTLTFEDFLFADAISYWGAGDRTQNKFASGYGLLVYGNDLSGGNIPTSGGRPDHKYTAYFTAGAGEDGNEMTLQFVDPDGDYSNNSDTFFTVRISTV